MAVNIIEISVTVDVRMVIQRSVYLYECVFKEPLQSYFQSL